MLNDLIGPILLRAAEVLDSEVRPAVAHDEFLAAQVDAIMVFVGEVGAMWPNLIRSLEEQNEIYWHAIQSVSDTPIEKPDDLATALAEAERVLGDLVEQLHDENARLDLARLRSALGEAARLQEQMIARARDMTSFEGVRRP